MPVAASAVLNPISMELKLESKLKRNEEHFLANPVGGEMIILNMETGDYLGLNTVGSFIWEQLATPIVLREMIERLHAAYEVDESTCLRETLVYLEKMKGFGLLEIIA